LFVCLLACMFVCLSVHLSVRNMTKKLFVQGCWYWSFRNWHMNEKSGCLKILKTAIDIVSLLKWWEVIVDRVLWDKELNIRKYVVCAKYLSSKQKYDNQCSRKSTGGTEREIGWKERGRPCKEMWVSHENSVSHRKFLALQGKKNFQTKGQYCTDIHIPNYLHSSNMFSEL